MVSSRGGFPACRRWAAVVLFSMWIRPGFRKIRPTVQSRRSEVFGVVPQYSWNVRRAMVSEVSRWLSRSDLVYRVRYSLFGRGGLLLRRLVVVEGSVDLARVVR